MVNRNFLGSYPLDDSTSTYPAAGGLPALLQEAMRRQSLQSAFLAPDDTSRAPQPSAAPEPRMLPSWLRQDQLIQPLSSNPTKSDLEPPRDSSFRQLVSRPQNVTAPSDGDQSSNAAPRDDRLATIFEVPPSWFSTHPADSNKLDGSARDPAACFATPGSGINSDTKAGEGLDDESELDPSEIIRRWWQSLSKSKKAEDEKKADTDKSPKTGDAKSKAETDERFSDYPYCNRQYIRENDDCNERAQRGVREDFVRACRERALERMKKCEENDGMPNLLEGPSKWSDRDEEESFKANRRLGDKSNNKPKKR